MAILSDEMTARLIGRTTALEGLTQILAMAAFGPQKQRNARELQDLLDMIMPQMRLTAANTIREFGLDEVRSTIALSAAYAVFDGVLPAVADQVALIERIRLQDAPPTGPRN